MSLLLILLGGSAFGHDLLMSWTTVTLRPDACELHVKIHAETVRSLIQDEAPEATFEPENFDNVRPLLKAFANRLYEVDAGDQRLSALQTDVTVVEDNLEFRLVYPRPPESPLRLKANYLSRVAPDFIAHVSVNDEAGKSLANKILKSADPSLEVALPSGASVGDASTFNSFLSFLKLGVEHILTGYDHLLFLCGLLVACRRFSSIITIVTCFTIAHSLTLAMAALDLVVISSRVVEPLIAASIVFVGVDNLLRRDDPKGRWALTFIFGLIHGFGFAGVLKQSGLGSGGAALLVPLFSFNLGVELGQLAVTALLLPLLWKLRERPLYARHGRRAISTAIALVGAYWLLQRLFFS